MQIIEENNRMGKTRELFKKIRDTKGTFHAKMGSIKDRNGVDWTEAEDIKKRWQEYTEELYKKDLHDRDNHDGVITHLELESLECEVKWAWGRITKSKANGGDGIPIELFQILKDDAVKVLHSLCQHIWKTQQEPQDWKIQFSFQFPQKINSKNAQITLQLHSFHVLSRLCSKSFNLGFSGTWTENFQIYKVDFKKVEDPEIKLPTSFGS